MVEFRAPGCAAYRQNTPRKSGYSALPDGGWCATADVETLTRASWSPAYAKVGAAPAGADRMYFAFVNNTTLGYGDIIPTEEWRLLGPITAMNGVLLFGWSTAVMFDVLRAAMAQGGSDADQRAA